MKNIKTITKKTTEYRTVPAYRMVAISPKAHKRLVKYCRANGLKIGATVEEWINEIA